MKFLSLYPKCVPVTLYITSRNRPMWFKSAVNSKYKRNTDLPTLTIFAYFVRFLHLLYACTLNNDYCTT